MVAATMSRPRCRVLPLLTLLVCIALNQAARDTLVHYKLATGADGLQDNLGQNGVHSPSTVTPRRRLLAGTVAAGKFCSADDECISSICAGTLPVRTCVLAAGGDCSAGTTTRLKNALCKTGLCSGGLCVEASGGDCTSGTGRCNSAACTTDTVCPISDLNLTKAMLTCTADATKKTSTCTAGANTDCVARCKKDVFEACSGASATVANGMCASGLCNGTTSGSVCLIAAGGTCTGDNQTHANSKCYTSLCVGTVSGTTGAVTAGTCKVKDGAPVAGDAATSGTASTAANCLSGYAFLKTDLVSPPTTTYNNLCVNQVFATCSGATGNKANVQCLTGTKCYQTSGTVCPADDTTACSGTCLIAIAGSCSGDNRTHANSKCVTGLCIGTVSPTTGAVTGGYCKIKDGQPVSGTAVADAVTQDTASNCASGKAFLKTVMGSPPTTTYNNLCVNRVLGTCDGTSANNANIQCVTGTSCHKSSGAVCVADNADACSGTCLIAIAGDCAGDNQTHASSQCVTGLCVGTVTAGVVTDGACKIKGGQPVDVTAPNSGATATATDCASAKAFKKGDHASPPDTTYASLCVNKVLGTCSGATGTKANVQCLTGTKCYQTSGTVCPTDDSTACSGTCLLEIDGVCTGDNQTHASSQCGSGLCVGALADGVFTGACKIKGGQPVELTAPNSGQTSDKSTCASAKAFAKADHASPPDTTYASLCVNQVLGTCNGATGTKANVQCLTGTSCYQTSGTVCPTDDTTACSGKCLFAAAASCTGDNQTHASSKCATGLCVGVVDGTTGAVSSGTCKVKDGQPVSGTAATSGTASSVSSCVSGKAFLKTDRVSPPTTTYSNLCAYQALGTCTGATGNKAKAQCTTGTSCFNSSGLVCPSDDTTACSGTCLIAVTDACTGDNQTHASSQCVSGVCSGTVNAVTGAVTAGHCMILDGGDCTANGDTYCSSGKCSSGTVCPLTDTTASNVLGVCTITDTKSNCTSTTSGDCIKRCLLSEGGACSGTTIALANAMCASGLCSGTASGSTCVKYDGGACSGATQAIANAKCASGVCSDKTAGYCLVSDEGPCYGVSSNSQCASTVCTGYAAGSYCKRSVGRTCSGADLATANGVCASGICSGIANTSICQSADGGACISNAQCVSGGCSNTTLGSVCLKTVLKACNASSECASSLCSGGKCLIPDGQTCSANDSCLSGGCSGGKCLASVNAKCAAAADCASAVCSNSKCVIADGKPCAASTECLSGVCAANACLVSVGGPCTAGSQCATGFCSGTVCLAEAPKTNTTTNTTNTTIDTSNLGTNQQTVDLSFAGADYNAITSDPAKLASFTSQVISQATAAFTAQGISADVKIASMKAGSIVVTLLVTLPAGTSLADSSAALKTFVDAVTSGSVFSQAFFDQFGITGVTAVITTPGYIAPTADSTSKNKSLAVGLGVGLGVGIPVVALAVAGGFFVMKRRQASSVGPKPDA